MSASYAARAIARRAKARADQREAEAEQAREQRMWDRLVGTMTAPLRTPDTAVVEPDPVPASELIEPDPLVEWRIAWLSRPDAAGHRVHGIDGEVAAVDEAEARNVFGWIHEHDPVEVLSVRRADTPRDEWEVTAVRTIWRLRVPFRVRVTADTREEARHLGETIARVRAGARFVEVVDVRRWW